MPVIEAVRRVFAREKIPWVFLVVTAVALAGQLVPGTREAWLYDRDGLQRGEWYRAWTGHLVHFGWPHFIADAGLFLILGRLLEREYPRLLRGALVLLPPAISLAIYRADPELGRYGGLSAVNLALLIFLASRGWQKDWRDWFWPAVLAIYVGEIVLEIRWGHGQGGGMIRFDDPTVHVATSAHIAAAGGGAVLVLLATLAARRSARSGARTRDIRP